MRSEGTGAGSTFTLNVYPEPFTPAEVQAKGPGLAGGCSPLKKTQKGFLFLQARLPSCPVSLRILGFWFRKFLGSLRPAGLLWRQTLGGHQRASETQQPFEFQVVLNVGQFEVRWQEHPSSPPRGRSDFLNDINRRLASQSAVSPPTSRFLAG